jgi:hypothetical protein
MGPARELSLVGVIFPAEGAISGELQRLCRLLSRS